MHDEDDPPERGCRLGVLAFGDSITNAGGELQWGVAMQSWALWTARALGLPYTPYAVDGAFVDDVVERQIPAFLAYNATTDPRYHLGCLYIGTNDVRAVGWDLRRFGERLDVALRFLADRCDRVLTATIPLDLGRPRAGAKVEQANRAIERCASVHGSLVLDLRRFGARNLIMWDHVHPTAFGQVAIAERVVALLERDGMTVRVHPSQLMTRWHPNRIQLLRSDLTYAGRHAKVSARAAWLTLRAR